MTGKVSCIKAAFIVSAPLYCGGFDQNTSEIRVASLRGALRSWWRYANGGRFESIGDMMSAESAIFGSARPGHSRQGILMSLSVEGGGHPVGSYQVSSLGYLGYGVCGRRPAMPAGARFTLTLRGRGLDEEQLGSLRDAISLMGLLGGIGGRARRGFGSLTLTHLEGDGAAGNAWTCPTTAQEFSERLSLLLGANTLNANPSFPAFAPGSRVFWLCEAKTPEAVQEALEGVLLGMMQSMAGASPAGYPNKIALGLPRGKWKPERHNRRASPLVFHVHQCGKDSYAGLVTLISGPFLPQGEKVKGPTGSVPAPADHVETLGNALQSLAGQHREFSQAREVYRR
ncbi:RAMP superfamily CRISPR-associated protein [Nitratidesulfovibrio liaohensis]|uniref:RAMP superfamily CRISPR-associated protein n=1 Tax=Nitratidesulfovibrio liaohensis TaxID=2604158 RepID=UPI00142164B0|nr:RAMP superfamily CRISPR-associated protein [Nitratidesulfovibrio liaohensis]